MKTLLAVVVIVIAIWFVPLMIEGAGGPCGALATQAVRIESQHDKGPGAPFALGLAKLLGDSVVSAVVQQRYPSIPPGAVCTAYYWRLLVDPNFINEVNPSPRRAG
nr:hypothetical protein [uncultured Rhodopila sp.]